LQCRTNYGANPAAELAAEYSSMIVKVERRRGAELYINDGAYGALYDAARVAWRFPGSGWR
jgi:ornithine decarboxylase